MVKLIVCYNHSRIRIVFRDIVYLWYTTIATGNRSH